MRALLDVNVLIALLDASHASHRAALDWFVANAADGWASCPITQNGCLRVMSSPSYPNTRSIAQVSERLREATSAPVHEFWSDDISVLDGAITDVSRIHGARQLTDVYLLALAVHHHGRQVTFNCGVPLAAATRATSKHLVVL
jgi:toxin-antitoxin system PIN domain toxin